MSTGFFRRASDLGIRSSHILSLPWEVEEDGLFIVDVEELEMLIGELRGD